jgi:hypothetical protein
VNVDWSRYRKCPACFAPLGSPCTSGAGVVVIGGVTQDRIVLSPRPHGGRRPRSQKGSTGA